MGFDHRTYTGLEKQTLGGHKQYLVCTRTHEKGAGTPQETDPNLPVSVQEFLVKLWVGSGLMQDWALSAAVCAWGLLKEVTISFITSPIVWSPVKQQGGNTAPPINRKLD